MSSTISDLFYGSKQNILDNYLLHKDETPNTLHSLFSIVLTLQLPSVRSGAYQVKAQMGQREVSDLFQLSKSRTNCLELCFAGISSTYLEDHTNIKIQILYLRQHVHGYIPIEVLLQLRNKTPMGGKASKAMAVLMKTMRGSHKFIDKLQCTLTLQSHSERVLESQLFDRSKSRSYKRSEQSFSDYIRQRHDTRTEKSSIKAEKIESEVRSISFILSSIKLKELEMGEFQIEVGNSSGPLKIGDKVHLQHYRRDGIDIRIWDSEGPVGTVHLNVVALLSNNIDGDFPIHDQSLQCVGILALSSPSAEHHVDLPSHNRPQSPRSVERQNEVSMIIHSSTILFIPKSPQLSIKTTEQCFLLVRVGNEVVSHSDNLHMSIISPQFYQLTISSPLLIHGIGDNIQFFEIQVYVSHILIGYARVGIHGPDEPVTYANKLANMTTDQWIANGLIQFIMVNVEPNYILPPTYQTMLPVLTDPTLIGIDDAKRVKYLVEQYPQLIYIECNRVVSLLSKANLTLLALASNQLSPDDRLYEEMMYLDHAKNGCIPSQQIQQIVEFYILSNVGMWTMPDDLVAYLFVLAGKTVEKIKGEDQPGEERKQEKIEIKEVEGKKRTQRKIRQIVCQNMHLLMEGEIPSVRTSMGKQIKYRSANPTFLVNATVSEGAEIVFYHHSIKMNQDVLLCRVAFEPNKCWQRGDTKISMI